MTNDEFKRAGELLFGKPWPPGLMASFLQVNVSTVKDWITGRRQVGPDQENDIMLALSARYIEIARFLEEMTGESVTSDHS